MLIAGDLASPDSQSTLSLKKSINLSKEIFSGKTIICNFEGLLYDKETLISRRPILYNHPSVVDLLNQYCKPVFCLSNNHILDLPEQYERTTGFLNKNKIPFAGAGRSMEEAFRPVIFKEDDHTIILFNACWSFLLYKTRNPSNGIFVAEIDEQRLLEEVKSYKKQFPDAVIIIYLHWNLDLESLPFPMYRQFSRDLIDAGALFIAGSHSHCIQGGERYMNGFIFYGLGNFFIPHKKFINGKLSYHDISRPELIVDWDIRLNEIKCHWFNYENPGIDHNLVFLGTEKFDESEVLRKYTPYAGLSERDYIKFYKQHRRKNLMIPILKDYRTKKTNSLYLHFLRTRAYIAHLMALLRIINW